MCGGNGVGPSFAVLIPTYNYGRYISRAIESVIHQAGPPVDVIVVDDGSTDDTASTVKRFGDRVTYIHQNNQGTGPACVAAFANIRPDQFVVFLDADDRLAPGFFDAIREVLSNDTEARVVFSRVCDVCRKGSHRVRPAQHLDPDRLTNFSRFLLGKLQVVAGGAVVAHEVLASFLNRCTDYIGCHGIDRALLGYALMNHACVVAPNAMVEIHDHDGRLRDNHQSFAATGLGVVEALFQPELLPPEAMRLRKVLLSRLYIEQARLFYRTDQYALARDAYSRAYRVRPLSMLSFRSLKRYAVSAVRGRTNTTKQITNDTPSPPGSSAQHRQQMRADPMGFLRHCAETVGPVVRFSFDRETYLLNRPDDIRHVLKAKPQSFHKEHVGRDWLDGLFSSVFFFEGEEHHALRERLKFFFRPSAMETLAQEVMVATEQMMDTWPEDEPFDLADQLQRLALRVSARRFFGPDHIDAVFELFAAAEHLHQRLVARLRHPVLWPDRKPAFLPDKYRRRHRRAIEKLDAVVLEIIRQHDATQSEANDLLSILLRSRRESDFVATDHELRDLMVPMTLAGTVSVGFSMSWAIDLLTHHPDYQDRIAEEAARVLGDDREPPPRYNALAETTRDLQESLRMKPPIWMIEREPIVDETLPSGTTLPTGCRVMISPYVLHHCPELYPDPERFDPNRFKGDAQKQRSPYAFIPFSMGPRACLGAPMTMIIGTTALATMLRRFEFSTPNPESQTLVTLNGFSTQPPDGVLMAQATRRSRLNAPQNIEIVVEAPPLRCPATKHQ